MGYFGAQGFKRIEQNQGPLCRGCSRGNDKLEAILGLLISGIVALCSGAYVGRLVSVVFFCGSVHLELARTFGMLESNRGLNLSLDTS